MAKTISREATITSLKEYLPHAGSTSATPDEIFAAAGRSDKPYEDNMNWLYGRLSLMREHNLFTKLFVTRDGKKYIDQIVLTSEGRKVLGRDANSHTNGGEQAEHMDAPHDQAIRPRVPEIVTLPFATEVTDAFNEQDPYWKWILVRKGQPM